MIDQWHTTPPAVLLLTMAQVTFHDEFFDVFEVAKKLKVHYPHYSPTARHAAHTDLAATPTHSHRKPDDPLNAFRIINVKLVGPYELLAGKFSKGDACIQTKLPYYLHWRYRFDPPEVLTVAAVMHSGE